MLHLADLSYGLEHYARAYEVYSMLRDKARLEGNRDKAVIGMMRSAYKGRDYENAALASLEVEKLSGLGDDLMRESLHIRVKSYLSSSRRTEAMSVIKELAGRPSTDEGAEASYILIQDAFDRADYDAVQDMVFDFSGKAGGQNYWLARCYITLADAFVQLGKKDQAKATLVSIRDGYTPERADDDIADLVQSRLDKLN